MLNRECVEMIKETLSNYPVDYHFEHGGKHPCVVISAAGGVRGKLPFPGTPSDRRHLLNAKGNLRRKLKELGISPRPDRIGRERVGVLGEILLNAAAATIASAEDEVIANYETEKQKKVMTQPNVVTNGSGAPAEAPKYMKLTQVEIVLASRLLQKNAMIDDEQKTVTYHEGWSDQRIADILKSAPDREMLRADHVTNFRRSNFGLLGNERRFSKSAGGTDDRLKAIEDRLSAIEDLITKKG